MLGLVGALLVLAPAPAGSADVPTPLLTERVSVASDGTQGNGDSRSPSVSGDGRYVAFSSDASNLVPGDTNGRSDVFVRDRETGTIRRVSISSAEEQADKSSGAPAISDDGQFVAFVSDATDLVPGATGTQLYVRDLAAGTTELASVSTAGNAADPQGSGFGSGWFDISGDGRYVAFVSAATNLEGADTNGMGDVFLRDRRAETTVRVSDASDGTQANDESFYPSVADNGAVAFTSWATNVVAEDTNRVADTFLFDPATSATRRVSLTAAGDESSFGSLDPDISADGSHVAYATSGGVVVRDLSTGTVETIVESGLDSEPSISSNGRYVMFMSASDSLATDENLSDPDLFVRDQAQGTTEQVTVTNDGREVDDQFLDLHGVMSADGSHFVFEQNDGGPKEVQYVDGDTNSQDDVIVVGPARQDDTGPSVVAVVTPDTPDGDSGWYTGTPTVRWRLVDAQSNVTSRPGCDTVTVSGDSDSDGTTYACTATSAGGTSEESITIRRDATRPTLTPTVTPALPDGTDDWFTTSPQVTFSCSDGASGVATCSPSAPVTLGESAAMQRVDAQATDVAGNVSTISSRGFFVDLTDPEVACNGHRTFELGQNGKVAATVTDSISGPLVSTERRAVDTSRVGSHSAEVTGHDWAGRSTTVSCGYDVHYAFAGFLGVVENPPTLNRVPAGSAVTARFGLDGFQGRRVVTAVGSAPVACSSTKLVAPTAQHVTSTTYLSGSYRYSWTTRRAWRGSCRVFTMELNDGTRHQARFRFTR